MSFLSRRESCPGGRRGIATSPSPVGQGQGASGSAHSGHPPPQGTAGAPHGRLPRQMNTVYLSGVLAADTQLDKGRDGEPVTLLLIAFAAPDPLDTDERPAMASQEVEVPRRVVAKHRGELRAGESIFIAGQLNGGGGILATEVHTGPPPGGSERSHRNIWT